MRKKLSDIKSLSREEVLKKLRNLQVVLRQRFQIEKEINDLPESLSSKTEELHRLKQSFIDNSELFEYIRHRIDELRGRAIEAERQRETYEGRMDEIKTQREYEALDKEIREAGNREVEVRRELQQEEQNLKDMEDSLKNDEERINSEEVQVTNEQKKIDDEISNRKDKLFELIKSETEISSGLDEELLFKFERIIRSKEGIGIVSLNANVCSGCFMIMPSFFVNQVRGSDDIIFCPNCSRIVFYGSDELESNQDEINNIDYGEDEMFDDAIVGFEESVDVTE